MNKKIIIIGMLIMILATLTAGCIGTYVVDEYRSINNGKEISYSLTEGTYQISISSDRNLNINIVGHVNVDGIKTFDRTIILDRDTKLIIENPFNLFGNSAEVSITVYK
ncbi:MAG: hypothetical protein HF967_06720 [Methanosarcinales archaeon]|jgi:hypothetical protein|nr:hypothetical protein [Methanosarcinales archaeon]